jgi:hypothetical protein
VRIATIAIIMLVGTPACAGFGTKGEQVQSVSSSPPAPEPDLDAAARRVIDGKDVIVSRNGDWLVALRCIWVLRDVHACEVAFVERGRVVGTVAVYDRSASDDRETQARAARRAVERALAEHLGSDRVALNAEYAYGARDSHSTSVFGVIEGGDLVVREMIFPHRDERGRTAWPYGEATTRANAYQSPRASDLVVLPIETAPDRATAFALVRATSARHTATEYRFVQYVPPMQRPADSPRFPTAGELRALHATVGREIEEQLQSHPTFSARMVQKKYGWFRVDEFLDSPTHRLDFTETLHSLRAQLRAAR